MRTIDAAQQGQQPADGDPRCSPTRKYTLTVQELLHVVQLLPPDAEVLIGVTDDHHFNVLLGQLPVHAAAAITGSAESALVLRVDGVS